MARTVTPPIGSIKGIQRGVISIAGAAGSGTATITSVNTSKTQLRLLGTSNASGNPPDVSAHVVLTNATTVTAQRGGTTGGLSVSWELTEMY